MDKFILHSEYKPTGDQPQAIEGLINGLKNGYREQTLLGVTGSGKIFTMANVIEKLNRLRLFLPITKRLQHSFVPNLESFSLKTQWNTLCHIMIITNQRRISPERINI